MLDTTEVAVERLASDGFSNQIEQFTKVLTGSQAPVPARVDVGEIQNRDGSLNVIGHLENLLDASPQFLSATGLYTNQCGTVLDDPREGRVIFGLVLIVPDLSTSIDNTSHDVGNLFIGLVSRFVFAIGTDVVSDVACVDNLRRLKTGLHLG